MTDVEARLRRTLSDALDPIVADPARARGAVRSAQRGRAARLVMVAIVAAAIAAASITAPWEPRPLRPAGEPVVAGAFEARFGRHATATIAVDELKSQLCVDLTRIRADHGAAVRFDAPGPADLSAGLIDRPIRGRGAPTCTPVVPAAARRLLAAPELHYLELDPGLSRRASALVPWDRDPEYAPDVLEIVCSPAGAVALAPEVQPQLDGVHLRIHDPGDEWGQVNLKPAAGGDVWLRLPRRGSLENALNFGPGSYSIACVRPGAEPSFERPGLPDYAAFTVVDPYDMWNDPELDCDERRQLREVVTGEPVGAPSVPPDFDLLVREHLPGLSPGDELERPTYPESASKGEPRTVVRDGVKVASLYLSVGDARRGERRWSILPVVCPGSGIGE